MSHFLCWILLEFNMCCSLEPEKTNTFKSVLAINGNLYNMSTGKRRHLSKLFNHYLYFTLSLILIVWHIHSYECVRVHFHHHRHTRSISMLYVVHRINRQQQQNNKSLNNIWLKKKILRLCQNSIHCEFLRICWLMLTKYDTLFLNRTNVYEWILYAKTTKYQFKK